MRIGFLFNHDQPHQVAHSLPIAAAMARHHADAELSLFVVGGAVESEVRRLWQKAGHSASDRRIQRLMPPSCPARMIARASGKAVPADRVSILARNRPRFRALDAMVVPEKTSTMLKTRFGLDNLALIHTRHGAGDRAIGFDAASAKFDLVLMSGPKIRDRLDDAGLLKPDGHAIVGYPKFDAGQTCDASAGSARLFDNDRPTVLYTPHPSPALSSWYLMGPHVINWFAQQDRFNLIFAPHVMLFAKRWTIGLRPLSFARPPAVPAIAYEQPHILVDKGSKASVDMTYTRVADIYLGDASSQLYEFLHEPRPAIFLDPHRHSWEGNPDFAHWQAGPVAHNIAEMETALEEALSEPQRYRAVQEKLFAQSIDIGDRPSSHRAADAIISWLGQRQACA